MSLHKLAGKPAPFEILENIPRIMASYYAMKPDPANLNEQVSFGTSGHRGSSIKKSFNENHILAVTQAICEYRAKIGVSGPLFMGIDTHALSEAAMATALEVFAANGVKVMIQQGLTWTPTPVISHAILTYNRGRKDGLADGVVITPSHNPPMDGGYKYNPANGGPADTSVTNLIQDRANQILTDGLSQVKRVSYEKAMKSDIVEEYDYIVPYVKDLGSIIDFDAISSAGLKIGVDPLGGAGLDYWDVIAEEYSLSIDVVNRDVDPRFSFMTVDKDGKIRMDCSSPHAMAGLISLKDKFDIAFGNDPDTDRHGIVTQTAGLMNPNHYLSVCVWYLFQNRPDWGGNAVIGKTLVSSSMIDRVANHLGKKLVEVPVGFKWFVEGLLEGTIGFCGEESAGASFLRKDGTVWATDKDGIILNLLAAEITATQEKDPGQVYNELEEKFGAPVYERIDAPVTPSQKAALKKLSPENLTADTLAGEKIETKLTRASGNDAAIGGLKVVTKNGWFAARPSGTEDIYKLYAESFLGKDHLKQIQDEALEIVNSVLGQ